MFHDYLSVMDTGDVVLNNLECWRKNCCLNVGRIIRGVNVPPVSD